MFYTDHMVRIDVASAEAVVMPVCHEVRFHRDVELHLGDDAPVRVRRGTVMSVAKSTGDSVDVSVPVSDSVVRFNIPHSELFERFHPVTESA